MYLKEGDRVKRERHRRDFLFRVQKIHHGFATIQHTILPITSIEPVRALQWVQERREGKRS